MKNDAKNNQAQLPRAPAQPEPACAPQRPFCGCWKLIALRACGSSHRDFPGLAAAVVFGAQLLSAKRSLCKAYLGCHANLASLPGFVCGCSTWRLTTVPLRCLELPEFLLGRLGAERRAWAPPWGYLTLASRPALHLTRTCTVPPPALYCSLIRLHQQRRGAQTFEPQLCDLHPALSLRILVSEMGVIVSAGVTTVTGGHMQNVPDPEQSFRASRRQVCAVGFPLSCWVARPQGPPI